MDRTLLGSPHVDVRGGSLVVLEGDASQGSLHIGPEPRVIGRRPGCHLVLSDRRVSATHCELVATENGVRLRDLGSTNGTFVGDSRVVEVLLHKATTFRCGDAILEFRPGKAERVAVSKAESFGPLVGSTPAMRALFEQLRTLAPTTVSVLIEGETGTGKEVVARAIHDASDRAAKPFVVVDCSAIPPTLAESTLFGHERGSFTGATERRKGALAEADGGTLFLDELGELPIEMQPRLLRVLADQRIKRVGSDSYVAINVRVVAATRRDLLLEINRGGFRDDLYFRIAEERIEVPPLRQRTEDLRPLVERIMQDLGRAEAFRRVTAESFDRLVRYDWPGNVRELRSLVKRALAYDRGGPLDLGGLLRASPLAEARRPANGHNRMVLRPHAEALEAHDRAYFGALFEAAQGNISEMARRSQLHRTTVREALERFHIKAVRRKA